MHWLPPWASARSPSAPVCALARSHWCPLCPSAEGELAQTARPAGLRRHLAPSLSLPVQLLLFDILLLAISLPLRWLCSTSTVTVPETRQVPAATPTRLRGRLASCLHLPLRLPCCYLPDSHLCFGSRCWPSSTRLPQPCPVGRLEQRHPQRHQLSRPEPPLDSLVFAGTGVRPPPASCLLLFPTVIALSSCFAACDSCT